MDVRARLRRRQILVTLHSVSRVSICYGKLLHSKRTPRLRPERL